MERDAEVNAKDKDENTALMLAAKNGYLEVIKVLLSKGADARAKNKYGLNAMKMAELNNHMDVAAFLWMWKVQP